MRRLDNQAFHILQTEVRRCLGSHKIGQAQIELALCRLEKLRLQVGTPATAADDEKVAEMRASAEKRMQSATLN